MCIFYIMYFIIGALLGSFFSLAVYRIPKKENITHKRSYCPKCNHRLEFIDLMPIFSYIFLKGKCRYCKEKISPRYILFELFSGLTFLIFAISMKLNLYDLEIEKLVYLLFGTIYIGVLFIIAGIDKENHTISKSVLLFGIIIQAIYMIYLYVLKNNIYGYVIYLFIMLILVLFETIYLKKKGNNNYTINILMLCIYLAMGTAEELVILSIIITLLVIAISQMVHKPEKERKEEKNVGIPIGTYLCFSNVVLLIIENFLR